MEPNYITKLHEQPLVTDYSEDYSEQGRQVHRANFVLAWDGEQVPNQWGDMVWRYKSVRIEQPLTYEAIIRAIVRSRYTADEVEAILLNAQLAPEVAGAKREEYRRELDELQNWRTEAKQIADQAMAAASIHEQTTR